MENESTATVYGHLDVSIPEAIYEAGKVSNVRILLRNPFDEPVDVLNIQGPRSPHLQEISDPAKTTSHSEDNSGSAEEDIVKPQNFWSRLLRTFTALTVVDISLGGIQMEFPRTDNALNIKADKNATVEFDTDIDSYGTVNVSAAEGSNIKFVTPKISQAETTKEIFTIQPHCETVAYFPVSTSGWLFFTPTRQSLSTQINYRLGENEKSQVISSGFEVKPPLKSMVIGSGLLLMWNKLVSRSDNRFGMPKADRPSSQLPPLPALPAYSGR